MITGTISSAWLCWLGRWDVDFLLAVQAEAEAQGVEPDDRGGVERVAGDVAFVRSISCPDTTEYRKRRARDRRRTPVHSGSDRA